MEGKKNYKSTHTFSLFFNNKGIIVINLYLSIFPFSLPNTHDESIRSNRCKYYTILTHQKPTLLLYHIILQYLIYQMFYIFTTSFKYYFLILFNSYFILSLLFVQR